LYAYFVALMLQSTRCLKHVACVCSLQRRSGWGNIVC